MWNEDGQPPLMGGGHQYTPSNGYSAPQQMQQPYMNRSSGPTPLMSSAQSAGPPPQMGGYWDASQMVAPPPTHQPQMTMQRQQQAGYGSRQQHQQQQQQSYGGWEQQQATHMQQQAQWQAHPQNAQWSAQSMGMMTTPPPPSVMGGGGGRQQQQHMAHQQQQQMNGGNTGYWNEQQGYNMMGDGGMSQQHSQQHSQHHSSHSHPQQHHQQHQQQHHQQQYSSHSQQMHSNRNNWHNNDHQQQQHTQSSWGGSQSGHSAGGYGQWENSKQHHGGGGGSEWSGGERERSNGRRDHQWMNGGSEGGHGRHDDRMSNNRYDQVESVGSWNPNDAPDDTPSNDMVWRDPNPKQKKPPARDIGTSIWGDPSHQRQVNLWTVPENAPSDFNWETSLGANPSLVTAGLGWDDPIPSDRASRASDIQKNITGADSAADLVHVSNQLATAVDKGILPVSVLARDLPPSAMTELNELLHCMTRIEHLQLERARAVVNHGQSGMKTDSQSSMIGSIDISIHQAKNEMERLRANICREDPEASATSKLNQWRKNETSIDHLLQATSKIVINDTRGVSDWLESSPAPHDASDLLDEDADGLKEFVPGRKWQWNDPNMIAQDPNITPGQVKQSPLVAVKTGDDNITRPVAPVDPMPHDPGVWLVFHHHNHMQHIYPVCTDLGRVVYFKIIDHQLYIKFASDVDPKLASSVLVRDFPAVGPSMRFISDNEMTAETSGNDVLQS